METSSHPLATESFSNNWLASRKHNSELPHEPLRPSLDFSSEAIPEEMNHKSLKPNKASEEDHNFNFDIPTSKTPPPPFVHADEIFSHGHILPIYGDPSSGNDLNAPPNSAICPPSCTKLTHFQFFKKWKKSSKKVLQKYIAFCCRKGGSLRGRRREVSDVESRPRRVRSLENSPSRRIVSFSWNWRDSERKEDTASFSEKWRGSERKETKKSDGSGRGKRRVMSCGSSPLASPPRSPSQYSMGDWNVDGSVYEAILHCKRSFEK